MPNLTPRALKGLKNYQYKSGGYTWLDDIHTPIWNGTSVSDLCNRPRSYLRLRRLVTAVCTDCPQTL